MSKYSKISKLLIALNYLFSGRRNKLKKSPSTKSIDRRISNDDQILNNNRPMQFEYNSGTFIQFIKYVTPNAEPPKDIFKDKHHLQ